MMVYILLALLAALFVGFPALKSSGLQQFTAAEKRRAEHNRRVHAEQLAELEADLEEGKIDAPQFAELEQELLTGYAATDRSDAQPSAAEGQTRLILLIASVCVVAASYVLYTKVGHHDDVAANAALQEYLARDASADESEQRAALLKLLPSIEERSGAKGSHLGWTFMLAQLQSQLQRYSEAADSYRSVLDKDESNADVWAEYAQASYLSDARRMSESVQASLQRALSINPHQRTALSLKGMHAFENQDFAAAEQSWSQLLAGLEPGSDYYRLISSARTRAREQAKGSSGGATAAASPAESAQSQTDSSAPVINVDVELAGHIKLPATTTVFVYARAAQGPKMPLAIQRLTIADLPTRIRLDDSMAMMPAMRLSMFDDIEVLARVSESGSPSPASGDWQASSGALKRAEIIAPLGLLISQQLP